ncbi:MAG: hydantoinase/oxoprolinase family protein [Eubacteriaceae bacterium]|jgi:N-methylhydantoinase A/oxoprolinase/acetone carboxylase beta subunit|nr:hydantoinase/oxoprolinase family protein [Eubacteriaceae bacterium]
MKTGIGIDTGGTCTDAVIYDFENRKILSYAKTATTKDDLSVGIGQVIDLLPEDLVEKAEVIALSTTLATNACVENKGGRSKLMLFGVEPRNVARVGQEYGISMDGNLLFFDSHTKPNGDITKEPDWNDVDERIDRDLYDCDAVGIAELFSKKTGAVLEKRAAEMINAKMDIPVVCGHELFSENNIMRRGASTLLNARLISVINEFMHAVKTALDVRGIKTPFFVVRSDGSLMNEEFAMKRPIETLLCGPVASVMGALELSDEENCMIVDMGGTTTDIAFVKNGSAQKVKDGVRIGKWKTFVKGLFVDTFALGGDSGVVLSDSREIVLENEKVMPLCMAADTYPELLEYLRDEDKVNSCAVNPQKDIFVAIKDIRGRSGYTEREKHIVEMFLNKPMSLEKAGRLSGDIVLRRQMERLINEGIVLRCGITPTDAMHVKGEFTMYSQEAAEIGIRRIGRMTGRSTDETAELIYEEVKRKLYCNIIRIMLEDAYPELRAKGMDDQMQMVVRDSYDRVKNSDYAELIRMNFKTPAVLVGVGAPTHLFLEDVGKLIGARVITNEYSKVANALGAIVGSISAVITVEIRFNVSSNTYTVFGAGEKVTADELDEAKETARKIARAKACEEAIGRGAEDDLTVTFDEQENISDTKYGTLYLGCVITATATGHIKID